MRKLVVSEFISLDGVIEAPEQWHFPYLSDDMQADVNEDILWASALLLGRVTYEAFAGFCPPQTQNEFGIADKLNNVPKFVVSTSLQTADWNNTTIISENVMEAVAQLKQQPGNHIGMTGSATLVQSLLQAGLIDEYRLLVHPIIVGRGKRLFKDGLDTTGLKLREAKTYNSGAVALIYHAERKAP